MKEKITKAEFINTWASEWDERTGWKVSEIYHQQMSEQLESLINQEVEKRIAERMPSDELTDLAEIEKIILSNYHHFKDSATVSWSMTAANIIIKLFRSRLTCSEKPNNSQKTEGGEG